MDYYPDDFASDYPGFADSYGDNSFSAADEGVMSGGSYQSPSWLKWIERGIQTGSQVAQTVRDVRQSFEDPNPQRVTTTTANRVPPNQQAPATNLKPWLIGGAVAIGVAFLAWLLIRGK